MIVASCWHQLEVFEAAGELVPQPLERVHVPAQHVPDAAADVHARRRWPRVGNLGRHPDILPAQAAAGGREPRSQRLTHCGLGAVALGRVDVRVPAVECGLEHGTAGDVLMRPVATAQPDRWDLQAAAQLDDWWLLQLRRPPSGGAPSRARHRRRRSGWRSECDMDRGEHCRATNGRHAGAAG